MDAKRIVVWLMRPHGRSMQGQWRDPDSGRLHTRSLGTRDEGEAEARRSDLEYEVNRGLLAEKGSESGPLTWQALRARYEAEKLSQRSERTREGASHALDEFERRQKPGLAAAVDERMIARHARHLRGRGLKPATVNTHLGYLRSALRWAARMKLIRSAPHIEMPELPEPPRRPWLDEAGYRRLLANLKGQWRLLLVVAWHTGFRRGELLGLEWGKHSVDMEGQRITLAASGTKARRARWQPIHPDLMRELQRTKPADRRGPLFDLKRGPQDVSKAFSRLASAAGCPGIGLHGIRRGFATRYAPKVTAAVLMRLMGHCDMRTTLQHYADMDASLDEAIRAA